MIRAQFIRNKAVRYWSNNEEVNKSQFDLVIAVANILEKSV